jgi:hypothetical protein
VRWTRRDFLRTSLGGLAWPLSRLSPDHARARRPTLPDPLLGPGGDSALAAALRGGLPLRGIPHRSPDASLGTLRGRFSDWRRHFVFEYYPWYGRDPFRHWDQWDRAPPDDIASRYYPLLGPYDSRSSKVLEQHARWIADSGVGALNVSWWGEGSYEDRGLGLLMDVMAAHGLKVTVHLEPYAADHGSALERDILYLVKTYGEKRRFDCLLLLENEDGSLGPVFKGFRTILPRQAVDCHGRVRPTWDFTPDDVFRRQTDRIRKALAGDFARVTLLADCLDFSRTRASGFDGVAVYDNFVPPDAYSHLGAGATREGLLFSFNVNPGYDAIAPRVREAGACPAPLSFVPDILPLDFSTAPGRAQAEAHSLERIRETLRATLAVQLDPALENARRGFFLVYLTSFNEWHEGHAFEPTRAWEDLTPAQRGWGYHNADRSDSRLAVLPDLLEATHG